MHFLIIAFALYPLKKIIATLEPQTCTLVDCYLNLVRLGAAIKKLPRNNNHYNFYQRFSEIDDDVYLLFFYISRYIVVRIKKLNLLLFLN